MVRVSSQALPMTCAQASIAARENCTWWQQSRKGTQGAEPAGKDNGPGWTRATRILLSRPRWLCKEQRHIQWATGPVLPLARWSQAGAGSLLGVLRRWWRALGCSQMLTTRSLWQRVKDTFLAWNFQLFSILMKRFHSITGFSHSAVVVVAVAAERRYVFNYPALPTRHLTHQRCSSAYRTGEPIMFLTVRREANR